MIKETKAVTVAPAKTETVSFAVDEDLGPHNVDIAGFTANFEVIRGIDTIPPETVIVSGPQGVINYNKITFKWSGNDDQSPVPELTYSYYLENFQKDYTPFASETSVTFTDLPDGSYTFYVQARDQKGNIDPPPANVKFTISLPADIVVSPGELAEGEKDFAVHVPLPQYQTVLSFVPEAISEGNIHCNIDKISYWWVESEGGKYMNRVLVKYRLKVGIGTPEGIHDLVRQYYILEGGGGTKQLGVIEFKLRVKVQSK